jgi:hypothetical protein
MKEGNVLSVTNARVNLFQGTPRLAADRTGVIQLAEGAPEVEPLVRRGILCCALVVARMLTPRVRALRRVSQLALNMSLIEYDVVTA